MIDVTNLLWEICEDKRVFDPDFDLLSSEVLDSFAMIELFSRLEDAGIELYPTRIDRESLRTPRRIAALIRQASASL